MITIKKILIFLCFFLCFNTLEVDSNSDKIVYYDNNDLYNKKVYKLYFDSLNSNELNELIKEKDLQILSYYIDGNKYYARDIDELDNIYLKDKPLSEKIYYEYNGYNIDAIKVLCDVNEIINLKDKTHIY